MAWGVPKLGTLVEDATGNFDLIEPAGVAEGDLMVACIAYRGNAALTLTGWSAVATAQNSGDTDATNGIASGAMFYVVRGSSAPNLTVTRTAGDVVLARVISYTPSAGTVPVYDTGSANTLASASVTGTTGTITTAKASELIVALASGGDAYTVSAFDAATDPTTASGATDTTTAPTNGTWIERHDSSTGTGADATLAIADAVRATAGATGTIQCTFSGSARQVMIAGAFYEEKKINVSDSITVTENRSLLIPTLFVNKSENITVSEAITNIFGTNTIVGSIDGGLAGYLVATKYTLATSGTVSKLSVYTTNTGNTKAAIYADSSGSPGARLVANNVSTAVTGGQWNDVSIPATYLEAGTYWLAFNDDTSSMRKAIATAGGSNKAAYNNLGYANGCPDPFPSVTFQDYDYVAYATYATIQVEETVSNEKYVSVSDSITVSESLSMFTDQLHRSVNDTITLTESTGRLLESSVNKSESITITENKVVDIPLTVSVNDLITISESTSTQLEITKAVSDSITITENRSLLIPELLITTSDNVTITDSIGKDIAVAVNTSDNITLTENADPELVSFVNKSDSITITENIQRLEESYVNKSDSVTITENVAATIVSVSDNNVTVSDSITLTESVNLLIPDLYKSVNDSITITESLKSELNSYINKSESITVSENVSVYHDTNIPTPQISVSDNITLTEAIGRLEESYVNKSESITISETVNVTLTNYNITTIDNVTVTENVQLNVSDPVPPVPYRLLRGARGTLLGAKQNNFRLLKRGPRQTRPPRSY